MMIYRISSAAAAAVCIMIAVNISAPALADEAPAEKIMMAATSDGTFEGILAIKEGHGDILVRAENGEQKRFKVKKTTLITRNGKPATYDELRARDQLSVRYNAERVVIELHASGS